MDTDNVSHTKYISTEMPIKKSNAEKMADRENSFFANKRNNIFQYMEKKVYEASKPQGLRFPRGVHMLILSNGKKMKYSIPVIEFITFMKNNHPEKKISKKLIPIKKLRKQLDDEIYYDLIINVV